MSPTRTDLGDGDVCPLFPEHGRMFTLHGSTPPMQWCSHVVHDGSGPADAQGVRPVASRSKWPLHGFEDSVKAYFARLDRAIREAGLPDLSTLEVQ